MSCLAACVFTVQAACLHRMHCELLEFYHYHLSKAGMLRYGNMRTVHESGPLGSSPESVYCIERLDAESSEVGRGSYVTAFCSVSSGGLYEGALFDPLGQGGLHPRGLSRQAFRKKSDRVRLNDASRTFPLGLDV